MSKNKKVQVSGTVTPVNGEIADVATIGEEKTISFVMPCFNDGSTIEKAVNSILDQDLPGIEMIVVNDGSTDDSKKVLDMLAETKGIKVIHFEQNQGACKARNEGARQAKGKYLSFLPADAILYPGVARIWYDTLEEYPDYDFLYGGYRIIDEDGNPVPDSDYLFQTFNPYLLETTNYIDGSFPIKREAFWKYAKIMNQPDGLWDSNIKSLQDWDFWLSVVKNGGKGIYVQDIFFGTTPPHAGGLSDDSHRNWVERTNAIKKKHNIPNRKVCVASLGAGWHAKRIAQMLNADFKEMPSFKPHEYQAIYVIGFYPQFAAQQDAMFLNNSYKVSEGRTAAKKVVHFVGTDIWQLYNLSLRSLKIWQDYMRNSVDVVLCEADFTQAELKELGIHAEICPIPPAKLYDIRPLPKEFTVACYMPLTNDQFYRPQEMRQIAKAMPNVKFKFFGNANEVGPDREISNIEHCGYVNDMDSFISECSAIMRFTHHDGLPLSVLEFLLAGRGAIASVPVPHALFQSTFSVEEAVKGIMELQKQIEPNKVASEYWHNELSHEKYAQRMAEYTGYNPKAYWENRAVQWIGQASVTPEDMPEVDAMLKKVNAKSVLDLGCGDARWYPNIKNAGCEKYRGIDISEKLIEAAKVRFPHEKDNFQAMKVEDMPSFANAEDKYELAFAYTCFEHIVAEDWPKAIEALKGQAKKLLLIEPINFTSRYYCHAHDYEKDFKVIEKVMLKDKVMLLCEL